MKHAIFYIVVLFIFSACHDDDPDIMEIPNQVEGLAPIYAVGDEWKMISIGPPQPQQLITASYINGDTEYLRESGLGIHVIDNRDTLMPKMVSFISIPGVHQIDFRDDSLIVGNYLDVAIFSIADPFAIKLSRRIDNVYLNSNLSKIPSTYFGFIECPQNDNGDIIGWNQANLREPQCWR